MSNVGDLKQSIDPATIQVLAKDDMALVEMWDNLLLQFETHHGLPHQDVTKIEVSNEMKLESGEQRESGDTVTQQTVLPSPTGVSQPENASHTNTQAQDIEDSENSDMGE
ncbi:hypothetical protein LIPSTDRAFT_910 [Lipomyces starkeyi NRRL Y-11557]|uniref:Uncharacterized protein n=1 Tax=Lipomyces starkeyi NRRL Y-11557 TaxID=675824 RepID=A0A1E3QDB2_LIPST|nr:hypothetical protein LIPSTDRAFT_910 [Lipomyces starkeyi NRRL Y-11557]